jgi:hypothetical protein
LKNYSLKTSKSDEIISFTGDRRTGDRRTGDRETGEKKTKFAKKDDFLSKTFVDFIEKFSLKS